MSRTFQQGYFREAAMPDVNRCGLCGGKPDWRVVREEPDGLGHHLQWACWQHLSYTANSPTGFTSEHFEEPKLMRKIPTAFLRDPEDMKHLLPVVNPGCEWVFAGEGVATRKYDGTCVMLDEAGAWWARREVKPGKTAPPGWVEVDHDETTGKRVGWEPIEQSPFVRFLPEALGPLTAFGSAVGGMSIPPGTYELLGPKINGNPEGARYHRLQSHARAQQLALQPWADGPDMAATAFAAWRTLLAELAEERWEGVVWHHPDGRMAKLKARDFR